MSTKLKPALKNIILIHTAMVVGQIIVAITLYLLQKKINPNPNIKHERSIQVIVMCIVIGSLLIGFNIFKKKIEALRNNEIVDTKLTLFNKACFTNFLFIEIACFTAIMGYFLTKNLSFIILFILLLLLFALQRPTILSITNYLKLTKKDIME